MIQRCTINVSLRRGGISLAVPILLTGLWLGVSAAASQRDRDAEVDRFFSSIPPVIGEFEACLEARPVTGLVAASSIRQIALTRLFWKMRERGDSIDAIADRLAVAGRQTERMRAIAARHLSEIKNDIGKLDGHCEHAAILVSELLEALR